MTAANQELGIHTVEQLGENIAIAEAMRAKRGVADHSMWRSVRAPS